MTHRQASAAAGLVAVVGLLALPLGATTPRGGIALRLNPNVATEAELALLPGIGPGLARAIAAYRETAAAPAYQTARDLERAPRIGPVTAGRLAPYWRFAESGGP